MLNDHYDAKKNLSNLLAYAEELLKAGEKVVADLSNDAIAVFYESEIASLEGVTVPKSNEDGDWLKVARLREIAAPIPAEIYSIWIVPPRSSGNPFETPRLRESQLVRVSKEEASDLVEAEIADRTDIMDPKGDRSATDDHVDAFLRLEHLLHFAAAFDEWVKGPWAEWEAAERPRRRSIAFYNRLFEIQQRASSMGDDVPIELVFGVGLARWVQSPGRINAPLIEALVELELAADSSIDVKPKVQAPRLTLRPYDKLELAGMGRLQKEATHQLERVYNDPDVGFSPHQRAGFEPVLRMCHSRLASDAIYEPDIRAAGDRTPPVFDEKLRISDGWVLYVRQRSSNFRCEDIQRLIAAIEASDGANLPSPAIRMTTRPTDAPIEKNPIDLTGLQGSLRNGPRDSGVSAGRIGGCVAGPEPTYFFPLSYNDNQMEIVRRLDQPDTSGVVVQGPPGTGKTHTIANIIAHYMATGRRVLVSAREPEALAAIQGKLPDSIRDLAIAVIHSDREGVRRLERAVSVLDSQVKQIDYRAYKERASELEEQLRRTEAALASAEERVRDCASLNLTAVEFRGETVFPMELTKRVEAERMAHVWFTDVLSGDPSVDLGFGDTDISDARRIREELGRDLIYSTGELPDLAILPEVGNLIAAHVALVSEWRADAHSVTADLPIVAFGPVAGVEEARELRRWLRDAALWTDEIGDADAWLSDVYGLLVGARPAHGDIKNGIRALCKEWIKLRSDARAFTLRNVLVPDMPLNDEAFEAAVNALADGRKPFGAFSFGAATAQVKVQLTSVRVDGATPESPAAWGCIRDFCAWQRRCRAFTRRWSSASVAVGYPLIFGESGAAISDLLRLGKFVEQLYLLADEAPRQLELVAALFPYGLEAERVVLHMDVARARESIGFCLDKEEHVGARLIHHKLAEFGASAKHPLHLAIRDVCSSLGDPDISERSLAGTWQEIMDEARRLCGFRERRMRLEVIAEAVANAGARDWSDALLGEFAGAEDASTPENWKATWEWATAAGMIRRLPNRAQLAALSSQRTELEDNRRKLLAEIVRVRTFLGLKQRITERVAAALQKYAMKVRQLGAGTGKSAERHRRAIREAALEAAGAVPCWILPEWRVAEQLPSELAAFDLVIIDEASQSDITALPAVLRGKKLLIVGDDKQVSPSAVGMEERTVVQLRETFLRGMDIANFLEPTTSLYDFASMTFPGGVVMLREHFRCVEPIILFSSRFYPKALIPLRVATADERIDPPLVDVFVPDGKRVRDVNAAEADFIVGEIACLLAHPDYARRTFGVISMIGDKQAKFVLDRLVEAIGTDAIAKHRIMCGNASAFQGQERDVIFLSLVACKTTARAQTARLMEQRFNVAMSRARDRMYLVRSVAAAELSSNDLKLAVIDHFRDPMSESIATTNVELLEETESGFEREFGGLLLSLGYRIRPQVRVGRYRIDFVVEGEGDRRLAVELDGDRYHGPERWFEDAHRQRALERLGWTFWRCWGSHWLSDRNECLDDLLATLARLGIQPVGGEPTRQIWTEHRIFKKAQGLGTGAQAAAAEIGGPVLAAVNEAIDLGVVRLPQSSTVNATIVELGDTVIVRFVDDNQIRRFRLTAGANNPDQGEVNAGQPIARALLGNGIEEELELIVGGRGRRVIIEKITKAA